MGSQSRLRPDRESVTKNCSCDVWRVNIDKVNNLFILAWVHRVNYDGDRFEWCPWCGKQLEIREDTDDPIAA